jgi:hypothetical protein
LKLNNNPIPLKYKDEFGPNTLNTTTQNLSC